MELKTKDSFIKRWKCGEKHDQGKHTKKCKVVSYWARVRYVDPATGKRKEATRHAPTLAAVSETRRELLKEIKKEIAAPAKDRKELFDEFADWFEENYVTEAEFRNGLKVSGRRSLGTTKAQLQALKNYFGKRRLESITHDSLQQFAKARRNEKIQFKVKQRERSVASVNRELSLLRRMLKAAVDQRWLEESPFGRKDPVILISHEHQRQRILTQTEELKLLAACDTPRRKHLEPIVVCALDTGMRLGEILKLVWRDVDLENNQITIIAFNAKSARERIVPVSDRLHDELVRLQAQAPKNPLERVFGVSSNVKRSFEGARHEAGLDDVRFHDLRHTFGSRLVGLGIPLAEVARLMGHADVKMTYRYINVNAETVQRAGAAINEHNARLATVKTTETVTETGN